jgi:hypothetical protein
MMSVYYDGLKLMIYTFYIWCRYHRMISSSVKETCILLTKMFSTGADFLKVNVLQKQNCNTEYLKIQKNSIWKIFKDRAGRVKTFVETRRS